jgi:DNA-binding MarR family transcriptional regulator
MTSVKGLDDYPFEERHVLLYLGLLMGQAREVILARRGMTDELRPSQFRVIAMVPPSGPGISITDLADRVGMTKQGIGQFVNVLVDSGHLVTEVDPRDARRRVVRRTTRGDEATMSLAKLLESLEERWAEAVGMRRYQEFRRTLEELAVS